MRKLKLISFLVAGVMMISSCTDVNDTLGSQILPDNSEMKVNSKSYSDFESYTVKIDSVATSSWGNAFLGSLVTPIWGQTNYSFVSAYTPYYSLDEDEGFGKNPVIDSAKFVLSVKSITGDSTLSQQVSVYTLDKTLPGYMDSTYYSNFPIGDYVSSVEPLLSMKLNGVGKVKADIPMDFIDQFIDTVGGHYFNDSLFIAKYPALFVKANEYFSGGKISNIDLTNSGIEIYFRAGFESDADTMYQDTTNMFYSMLKQSGYIDAYATMIEHDYTLADPVVGLKYQTINDTINSQSTCYIQSQGGLLTKIDLNKAYFDELLESVKTAGFSTIAITSAKLSIPLSDPTPTLMINAPTQLGSYINKEDNYFVADYEAELAAIAAGESSSYYGGYLNRVTKAYELNIASHVQSLISGDSEDYQIEFGNAAGVDYYYGGVALNAEKSTLNITYVLVK